MMPFHQGLGLGACRPVFGALWITLLDKAAIARGLSLPEPEHYQFNHPHQYQVQRRLQSLDPLVKTAYLSLGVIGKSARPRSCLPSLTDSVIVLQEKSSTYAALQKNVHRVLRRRLPQALTRSNLPLGAAVMASTWLFVRVHGDDPDERRWQALSGLIYGAAYALTGWNLAVPAIAHLTYNALAVLLRDSDPVPFIPPLRHGMIVQVEKDPGLLKRMMQGHGGWDYRMEALSRRAGQVVGFSKTTGDPVVRFPFGSICHFNDLALVPLYGACVTLCSHLSKKLMVRPAAKPYIQVGEP
jgi:hypothetical protein